MAATTDAGANGTRSAIQLTPMAVPKASDVLANELRERILNGEFAEGTALPTERELVAQTRMSRTTVREALRILEIQGLLRIKAGRAGGTFVQHPGKESVATTVGLLIRGQQLRLSSIHETREAIEPFCARLAAQNRTDEDLAALDAANAAIAAEGTLEDFLQANVDWHIAVATASHNEILAGMMIALSRAIFTATNNRGFVDEKIRTITEKAHRTVTEAIRKQDAEASMRRMSRHVHAYAEAALEVEERTAISLPES
jgi:DNA-binding FadR family transcriptional regulator